MICPTLQFRIVHILDHLFVNAWCFVQWRLIFYRESIIEIWFHWWVIVWTITNKCWSMNMSTKVHCLTICMVSELHTSKHFAFETNVFPRLVYVWWNNKLVLQLLFFRMLNPHFLMIEIECCHWAISIDQVPLQQCGWMLRTI